MPYPQVESGADVIEDSEGGEKSDILKGASDAATRDGVWPQTGDGFSDKLDGAGGWPIDAGNDVEDGCFAGAIWADQANEIA